jgi:2-keto-4-pentenoate hydratase/2-oxohepta-3-ene-1,7-dioic acid hydratase in catechol pathway
LSYRHQWHNEKVIKWPPGKVVCVGRNYAAHAHELGNEVPVEPLLFMKPASAMVSLDGPIHVLRDLGELHHEAEIAILVGSALTAADVGQVQDAIAGIGLGLDLTLRELQTRLKAKGHPWERAKAFDGSCPLSRFVPIRDFDSLSEIEIRFSVNGELRQQGTSAQMLFDIVALIVEISGVFTLEPGDVVLTGTPAGVGPLHDGDCFELELPGYLKVSSSISR